jgi:hypothetical protein
MREANCKARIRLNDYERGWCPKHVFLDGSIHAIKANNYTVPALKKANRARIAG